MEDFVGVMEEGETSMGLFDFGGGGGDGEGEGFVVAFWEGGHFILLICLWGWLVVLLQGVSAWVVKVVKMVDVSWRLEVGLVVGWTRTLMATADYLCFR